MTDEYDPQRDAAESYDAAIAAKRAQLLMSECPAAKRVEVIGACTLYLGDCLEIMPTLGRVDAVVTDPPYEFQASGAGIFRSNRKCMDKIQETGLDKGFDISILRGDLYKSVVVFCHNDQLDRLIPHLKSQFGRFALCFWHKENPMPVANRHYRPDTEIYVHAWGEGGYPVGTLQDKARYFFAPTGAQSQFDHPTVKPLPLMDKIIGNVNGNTVLDPFMGSGTTGVSCIRRGKTFVGIEQHEPYFDIAVKRIRDAYRQPDMFVEAERPKAEQIGMFSDATP